jgi:hypothetical protein
MREASVGGIFELIHDYVLRGHTQKLPELSDYAMYLVVTPFAGREAAGEAVAGT